ncbi:MAG: hypothetical protein R2852_09970 [Bacteroidia bacterium]
MGIQMWGYFVLIQPYSNIKNSLTDLIQLDISNTIPIDLLAKEFVFIEPLFEYQKCGLEKIKKRTITTTVINYDSKGKISNQYPRVELDTQLYLSSISEDLGSVMSFPYFSKTDTLQEKGNYLYIKSGQEHINHYLKDLRLKKDSATGQIVKIEGKLIIHSYSKEGHSTEDRIYVANFKKVGECYFPSEVMYYSLKDKNLKQPMLKLEIEYELK